MSVKKWFVRLVVLTLCVMTLGACLQVSAREVTLKCEYVRITGEGFVAETFNGVEARYNRYGRTLYCTELVQRYYKEVYGITVRCNGSQGPTVVGNENYWFRKTETPRPGDVMFASAGRRGVGYNHWAICKSADMQSGTITLFEQNWRWSGKAGVSRQIPYENNCYVYYELVCADGRAPMLAA